MNYNFHTHTVRCRHATGSCEDYINRAIQNNIKHMGFSDHIPFITPDGNESRYRVPVSEGREYVEELRALREKYLGKIEIRIGFESEYYPAYFDRMLKTALDLGAEYLILGQHFSDGDVKGEHNSKPTEDEAKLIRYADTVCEGIESGFFTYVAHPDVINFVGDREIYKREMRRICIASRENNIPLEINFLGIREERNYPNPLFWEIVGEEGSPVTFGFDAHEANAAYDGSSLTKAEEMVAKYNLKYIGKPKLILIQEREQKMKTSNSHVYEYENLQKTKPLLAFEEGMDLDEWKKEAKAKLTELLGLPLNECEPVLTMESTEEWEKCTNYRFTVETEPGYLIPCNLLVPKGVGKAPLTICLSGHGNGMHIALGIAKTEGDQRTINSWKHRVMGPRSIDEGRCALVIEARNFGETSLQGIGNTCTEAAKIAIIMGRTVIGERVWDVMKALDAIEKQFDCVDMTDIVCTGNSGGGTACYYLAAMDERITAAAPSCSICSYEGSIAAMPHCLCNHIPSIRKYFEMGDLAGLIAPRKLVIAAGKGDKDFPIYHTVENFEKIKLIYKAAGAEENCSLEIADGGHLNYADHLWKKLHEMGV